MLSPTKPLPAPPVPPIPAPVKSSPVPVPIPTPVPAPPRPSTPFVAKEEGLLYKEDFEDGGADDWALGEGWGIERDDGNHVLAGHRHSFTRPIVSGWTDYTAEARFKITAGGFHFNFRYSPAPSHMGLARVGINRYFLSTHQNGIWLYKQIDQDFFELTSAKLNLESNKWHQIRIALDGVIIKVYLDDQLKIDYSDNDLPLRSGEIAFETLEDSHVLFDDATVSGVKLSQRSRWVKTGGPSGGLGYDVRIHPQDKKIMFVTDNPSGVNKSYDGGNSWLQRNTGITSRTGGSSDGIPIFCLTIDPNNANIVWAGTQFMRGIFKSTDGGETWTKKDNGIKEWNGITFRGFSVRPGNSNIVFAGAEISTGIQGVESEKVKGKIYRTEDGGENWYCVWEGDNLVRFVLFNYQNPDIIYASTGIFDREAYNHVGVGILKSTDGGKTWNQSNNGLNNLYVGSLEIHPANPNILFAAVGECTHNPRVDRGIYRTTDGGQNWTEVLTHTDSDVFTAVTISPSNPNVVYAGTKATFYRSDDGGETWQSFYKREELFFGPPGIIAGIPIGAVVDPDDPMTIFVNNYNGGVFKSTDGARTWINSSMGYTGADLHDIAIDPNNPATVYTIGRSGPFRSFRSGKEWTGIAFPPARNDEWYAVAVNPKKPQEVIVSDERQGNIYKSTDGGNDWKKVLHHPGAYMGIDINARQGFKTIVYSPSNPDIVYAGMRKQRNTVNSGRATASFGVYQSTDAGNNWREINSGLENSTKNINCIAVHPWNPEIAYAGTLQDGVYKTTDGGMHWVPLSSGLMSLDVRSLAIDPRNPETVYAGLGEGAGLFKTTDGGKLWEGVNYGIRIECPSYLQRVGQVRPGVSLVKPKRLVGGDYVSVPWTVISSIVIDPQEPQTVYAADYSLGVYRSTDGGLSWLAINEGLSTKAVMALALSADGWVLYAATSGEGVFRLELW